MAKRAAAKGAMMVLDIKGRDLVTCLPFRPAVVKPNLSEFLATFPAPRSAYPGAAYPGATSANTASSADALRAHVQEYAVAGRNDTARSLS